MASSYANVVNARQASAKKLNIDYTSSGPLKPDYLCPTQLSFNLRQILMETMNEVRPQPQMWQAGALPLGRVQSEVFQMEILVETM